MARQITLSYHNPYGFNGGYYANVRGFMFKAETVLETPAQVYAYLMKYNKDIGFGSRNCVLTVEKSVPREHVPDFAALDQNSGLEQKVNKLTVKVQEGKRPSVKDFQPRD